MPENEGGALPEAERRADLVPDVLPRTPSVPGSTRRQGSVPIVRDLTQPPADLWERIRNGFSLPDLDSPLVREQESWYAARPDYIKRMAIRSQRYLFHIVEEVERRGMPLEIALLPMIESAFNPVAYSRSHASGIWQFIPSTGKDFGLEQNFWHDQRRDVMAATRAALDYLEKLYDQFGTWDLALAAYNWGEGAVSRAIQRNEQKGLGTDYQSLPMPNETRYYFPKLQAVKNIVANPAQFNTELGAIPNQPYFTTVEINKHMDVKVAARLAEMPVDEFLALNPAHNRPVIRADGTKHLLLPPDKAERFSSNLENHDKPLVSWQAYTPKRGEGIDRIAARFGTTADDLRQANGITNRRVNLAGRTLLVPSRAGDGANLDVGSASAVPVADEPAAPSRPAGHIVRAGDTVASIARRYGVSPAQLTAWNGLRSNRVTQGQHLAVAPPAANVTARNGTVAVKATPKRQAVARTVAKSPAATKPARRTATIRNPRNR